jgi:hypothetical protein
MTSIRIFGTQELAGDKWRFFGPTYATAELAQQAIDIRRSRGYSWDMKVASIRRIIK